MGDSLDITEWVEQFTILHESSRILTFIVLDYSGDSWSVWNRGIRTEQNRADYLFDVNYTVSSQSNTKIIYIPRSQILLKCLNQVIVLILLSWLNPYMPIKLRFWSAFMGLHLWLWYFLIILTYYYRCILWLIQMLEFLIISNQVSSIMHFNNWRLSPIPSPSPLPPTQKVHVASLLCRYEPRHEYPTM